MLTSISPLGERARGNRWSVTVGAYLLGSLLGGAAVGGLLGAVGQLLLRPLPLVAALVCLAAAVADLAGLLPHGRRQVDDTWLTRYRGWVYGFGFGSQLGVGVVTIVTSAATYAVWLLELLSGGWRAGLLIGKGGLWGNVIRMSPPLNIAKSDVDEAIRMLDISLASVEEKNAALTGKA